MKSEKKIKRMAIYLSPVLLLAAALAVFLSHGLTLKALYADKEMKQEILDGYAEEIEQDRQALAEISGEQEILALVYPQITVDVYALPSKDSEKVRTLNIGASVMIRDLFLEPVDGAGKFGNLWNYVKFYIGEEEVWGYIEEEYLLSSDERYLNWKADSVLMELSEMTFLRPMLMAAPRAGLLTTGAGTPETVSGGDAGSETGENVDENVDTGETGYADIDLFPISYRASLVTLKEAHPTWTFVPYVTGIDWETAAANEIDGEKSLVHKSLADCMKEGAYDQGNWFYASEEALKYYMDPRNGLTQDRIFQFELLSYNASCQTSEALEAFLNNTFMASSGGEAPGTVLTYTQIIWAIGAEMGTSPFHLAARIYQEQGAGNSPLISGTVPGFEGYYNYFNIKASGKTQDEIVTNGLTYAKENKWDSAYASIYGGADIISQNYIQRQQDTLYLQKFNVSPNGTYWHQYMQNISAAATEALSIKRLYESANALESTFLFRIPVYENMPEEASPMPTSSLNVVIAPPSGYTGSVYLDGIEYGAVSRNGQLIVKAQDAERTNAVMYKYNESGVPVGMYVWALSYQNQTYVETAQPQLEDLLSYHGFSIRITGKAGIRFKTGIVQDLKNLLITEGADGYVLKEYGTLVMQNTNRGAYPMIRGGAKVASGLSYGIEDGKAVDKVYETVSGRQRFTSVLVGLPASQYKTEFAFRGYAVFEKEGQEITIYGPIQARSIYNLALQVLAAGSYPEESSAYQFLTQLIVEAQ